MCYRFVANFENARSPRPEFLNLIEHLFMLRKTYWIENFLGDAKKANAVVPTVPNYSAANNHVREMSIRIYKEKLGIIDERVTDERE